MHFVIQIFLKFCLALPCQSQISKLKRNISIKQHELNSFKLFLRVLNYKLYASCRLKKKNNHILRTIPSIFLVNWLPHCCFNFVTILRSCPLFALLSDISRPARFSLQCSNTMYLVHSILFVHQSLLANLNWYTFEIYHGKNNK